MRHPHSKHRAFTLVELMIVMAIIAIMISMILPAISRSRKAAQAVTCMSNLRGWGQAITLYSTENKARYWVDYGNLPTPGSGTGTWMRTLAQYYSYVDRFRLCPVAQDDTNTWGSLTFMSWGPIPKSANFLFDPKDNGSYGINHWMNDLPRTGAFTGGWRNRPELQWRKARGHFGKPSESPMIGDCEWYGANPLDLASGSLAGSVPAVENALYKQHYGTNMWQYDMARFAMNRHGKGINMCFEDGSVRPVTKAELWTLNWYRGFRPAKVTVPF